MNEYLATEPPIDGSNIERPMIAFSEDRSSANGGEWRHAIWRDRIYRDPKALRWTNDASDYSRRSVK